MATCAVSHGFQKTNVNDVFQIDHAARLYTLLYPVAALRRLERDEMMNEAVEDFHRLVRQAVFDRMSVSHVVSDRVESDPGWPVAAEGIWEGHPFVIQSNPGRLPRAYVVPAALVAASGGRFDTGQLGLIDPRRYVLMDVDPLGGAPAGGRQPFTPAAWEKADPDNPIVRADHHRARPLGSRRYVDARVERLGRRGERASAARQPCPARDSAGQARAAYHCASIPAAGILAGLFAYARVEPDLDRVLRFGNQGVGSTRSITPTSIPCPPPV